MVSTHHRSSAPSTGIYATHRTAIIKDLRRVNLQNELYPLHDHPTHVQESVEIIPQPVSCERIFSSYIDDHTDTRTRTRIKLDLCTDERCSDDSDSIYANKSAYHHHRLKFDFYSTTLFIYPKQRNEKFVSEIRYLPEHITIRYRTSLEVMEPLSNTQEQYYQNIQDIYQLARDIFYRI